MPAPTAAELEQTAVDALTDAGLKGDAMDRLAKALAATTAEALASLVSESQVLPGIPAAVDPTSGAGSTAGPGFILPPLTLAPQLPDLAKEKLEDNGIVGTGKDPLAEVIAAALVAAIGLFAHQVQVAPGIAVAAFATAAPGSLL